MKKSILILCIMLSCAGAASAQLAGTRWKGLPHIPDPYEAVLDFGKDTVLLVVEQNVVVETMTYVLKGDTLVLKKLDGKSPCNAGSEGSFKLVKDADKFTLVSLKDDCADRAAAFITAPWVRQKQ